MSDFDGKKYKTECCDHVYFGENHSPIRVDGYCMHCGYHPKIDKLEKENIELKIDKAYIKHANEEIDYCHNQLKEAETILEYYLESLRYNGADKARQYFKKYKETQNDN